MSGKMRWQSQTRADLNHFAHRFGIPTLKETLASESTEREIADMYDAAYKYYLGMGRAEEEAVKMAKFHAHEKRDEIIRRWELSVHHLVDQALWKIGLVSSIVRDVSGDAVVEYTTRTYPSKTQWSDAARLLSYYISRSPSLEMAMESEDIVSTQAYVQRHIFDLPKVWMATMDQTPFTAFSETYKSRSS